LTSQNDERFYAKIVAFVQYIRGNFARRKYAPILPPALIGENYNGDLYSINYWRKFIPPKVSAILR
jgi:hypothetical protein